MVLPSSGHAGEAQAQMGGKVRRIVARSIDEGRFAPAHEWQAHDVHPGRPHAATVVMDPPLAIKDWDI